MSMGARVLAARARRGHPFTMAITQLATQVYLDGLSRLGLDGADIARRVDLPTRAAHVDERALAAVWGEARRQALVSRARRWRIASPATPRWQQASAWA